MNWALDSDPGVDSDPCNSNSGSSRSDSGSGFGSTKKWNHNTSNFYRENSGSTGGISSNRVKSGARKLRIFALFGLIILILSILYKKAMPNPGVEHMPRARQSGALPSELSTHSYKHTDNFKICQALC